jgi:hypothetical protein
MKRILHSAVAGGGLSFVCYFGLIEPLINPSHTWIYHDDGAAAPFFLPVVINAVLLWVFFSLLLLLAGMSGRMRVMVWSGVILFAPRWLLKDVFQLSQWTLPHWLSIAIFFACALSWIAVNAAWRASFVPVFEHARHFSSRMLAVACLAGFLAMGQMSWYLWEARSLNSPHRLHSSMDNAAAAEPGPRPRVIWIVLDELSYQQVYERRFPSLALPAFDRLASQSAVFTRVSPASNRTETAVPSLMTGLRVNLIRAGADGGLEQLHDPATGRWQPFHAQDTVFQDALDRGFRPGIAGWYNPYCRILADVLDSCRWVFKDEYEQGIRPGASTLSNLVGSWRDTLAHVGFRRFQAPESSESLVETEAHVADYLYLVSAGDRLLRDSSVDFLLLHIPVPHPGGIYDRRTGTFTTHRSSYIDNLALADSYLAHVRYVLEQRGEWDSSAIVVMGDHSWRTQLFWKTSPSWTAEDEAASHGGQFDDRPGYIVKLPHQTVAAKIDAPFSAVRTRALLRGILDGSIRSVPELADFAGQPRNQGERPQLPATRVEGAGTGSRGR